MSNNKLPPEIIDHWPEIFNDVEIKAIPIEYLHAINVHFKDGRTWSIDMKKNKKSSSVEEIENSLQEFFEEYDSLIETVDFSLNTAKVKKDVVLHTKRFLKRRV